CMRRTRSLELVVFDPEIEQTLYHLRRERRNQATNMAKERDHHHSHNNNREHYEITSDL
ncbi:hypothetical protein OWV82_010548, partial [Melia azedarach]